MLFEKILTVEEKKNWKLNDDKLIDQQPDYKDIWEKQSKCLDLDYFDSSDS